MRDLATSLDTFMKLRPVSFDWKHDDAARRLAEAGCSANEIAAITGHATLQEVSRYTKAAEQKKLAQSAMRRLSPPKPRSDSQTTPRGLGIPPKKINEISGGSEGWWSRGESNP